MSIPSPLVYMDRILFMERNNEVCTLGFHSIGTAEELNPVRTVLRFDGETSFEDACNVLREYDPSVFFAEDFDDSVEEEKTHSIQVTRGSPWTILRSEIPSEAFRYFLFVAEIYTKDEEVYKFPKAGCWPGNPEWGNRVTHMLLVWAESHGRFWYDPDQDCWNYK